MKDVQATLRRIDEEITASRQEIARQQVNIVRLEDTRRVLMGLAEADEAAALDRKMERQHANLIEGQSAKPMLIVRKVGTGEINSEEAPLGVVASGKRKGLPRVRKPRGGAKITRQQRTKGSDLRERILKVVEPGDEPMGPKEIGNNIGLSPKEEDRKPFWNQLYQLRTKGVLRRDNEGRYYRPGEPPQQQAAQ